jgi:hypothetical protein
MNAVLSIILSGLFQFERDIKYQNIKRASAARIKQLTSRELDNGVAERGRKPPTRVAKPEKTSDSRPRREDMAPTLTSTRVNCAGGPLIH